MGELFSGKACRGQEMSLEVKTKKERKKGHETKKAVIHLGFAASFVTLSFLTGMDFFFLGNNLS